MAHIGSLIGGATIVRRPKITGRARYRGRSAETLPRPNPINACVDRKRPSMSLIPVGSFDPTQGDSATGHVTHASRLAQRGWSRSRLAVLAIGGAALLPASLTFISSGPAAAAPVKSAYGPSIEIAGRGFGHGRGMGQWGAYGYAVDLGWGAGQIMDLYYGGTVGVQGDPNATVSVRLQELDGRDTIVVNDQARLLTSAAPGWQPLTADGLPPVPGTPPIVFPGTSPIAFDVAAYDVNSPEPTAHLAVCEPDNQRRYYRGGMQAWMDTTGVARTVNVLGIESYLRGNVPREMPAGWGDAGGGRGIEALAVQAVAARSYALAQRRYSYAMTCDTQSCQMYRGMAEAPAVGGTIKRLEDPRSDRAILATQGQVRLVKGAIGSLEYSSSTGGWTAGGTFPAVADQGDATSANPQKSWKVTVPTATIAGKYPQIGGVDLIEVTERNGFGEWGGRVRQVKLTGPSGSMTVSGWDFSKALGLKSDWFNVITQPLPVAVPPPTTTPGTPDTPAPVPAPTNRLALAPIGAASSGANRFWATDGAGNVAGGNGAVPLGAGVGGRPVVAMASVPDVGYWLVAADGTVAAYGVPAVGSAPASTSPVVAIAARPAGGVWVVRANGTVVALGGAPGIGQINRKLRKPIVAAAATASNGGFFLLASDGSLFAFGDAKFAGSTRAAKFKAGASSIATTANGGYLVAHSDGTVRSFGGAPNLGQANRAGVAAIEIVATPSGQGYRVVWSDGQFDSYGDAL
jgi:SpoIID/LytB domain protein